MTKDQIRGSYKHRTGVESEKGFTLVELAVVMIIIGLLIGGVLKGQELITNAQISSTVTQIRGIDTAAVTFRDMYNSLPGTIRSPATRLPNCDTNTACVPSGGTAANGRLDTGFNADPAAGTDETAAFFLHMAKADLLGGIDDSVDAEVFGGLFPEANVSGAGFHAAYSTGGTDPAELPGLITGNNTRSGHYLALHSSDTAGDEIGSDSPILSPNMAARIDRKLDDGSATTGTILAFGDGTNPELCADDDGIYAEANTDLDCGLYIRIQQ